MRVPPPTRGWTRRRAVYRGGGAGSPAHAGMDPLQDLGDLPALWFPRPRGDGPSASKRGHPSIRVPPPTRGWTRRSVPRVRAASGSPAHAGMDPRSSTTGVRSAGFPRPRGDGPTIAPTSPAAAWVPPPTRGWTRIQAECDRLANGSPAHAGMDPAGGHHGQDPIRTSHAADRHLGSMGDRDAPTRMRFPRPRGDGPSPTTPRSAWTMVPPPARGWNPEPCRLRRLPLGGAHARKLG